MRGHSWWIATGCRAAYSTLGVRPEGIRGPQLSTKKGEFYPRRLEAVIEVE